MDGQKEQKQTNTPQYASFGLNEKPAAVFVKSKYEHYVKDGNEIPMPAWVPNSTHKWLTEIDNVFRGVGKTSENPIGNISKIASDCLKEADDPHWAVLYLVSTIADYVDVGAMDPSLARIVVTAFEKNTEYKLLKPSADVTKAAFLVAFRQNDEFVLDTFCEIYFLHKNAELFVPFIKRDVRGKRYEAAARVVHLFGLQSYFLIEDILFPFYLQNRFDQMEAYMEKSDTNQHNWLVLYLDKFYTKNSDMADVAASLDVPNVEPSQLSDESLLKAINHFAKKYNVSNRFWPNVDKAIKLINAAVTLAANRKHASINLDSAMTLFYERGSIAKEEFADILLEIVGVDQKLQHDVVSKMTKYDVRGAAWMSLNFGMSTANLPEKILACRIDGLQEGPSRREQEQREREQQMKRKNWYEPIPYEAWRSGEQVCGSSEFTPALKVHLQNVTDHETFVNLMEDIRKKYSTVNNFRMAIDCKCKPVFDSSPPRLSVLLVATNFTFIAVDVLAMDPKHADEDWAAFIELLSNEAIRKIAYDFVNGCCVAMASIPALKDIANITKNLLDLKDLCDGVLAESPSIFPYFVGVKPKNRWFESYVELCLGVTLSKKTVSNWDRRPLLVSQIERAGVNVECLWIIHFVLLIISGGKKIVDLNDFLSKCAMRPN